jgi:FtsH-binding integral membrane protein
MVRLEIPIDMASSSSAAPHRFRGRLFLVLGLGLAVLGVVAYVAQLSLQRLMAPWYMPILASVGVVLVIISLWERRTLWRVLALVAVVGLASAESAILYALRLPPYTGPIAVGRPFPTFEAKRANGTPFTERDLAGDNNNVLVVFRGRW